MKQLFEFNLPGRVCTRSGIWVTSTACVDPWTNMYSPQAHLRARPYYRLQLRVKLAHLRRNSMESRLSHTQFSLTIRTTWEKQNAPVLDSSHHYPDVAALLEPRIVAGRRALPELGTGQRDTFSCASLTRVHCRRMPGSQDM